MVFRVPGQQDYSENVMLGDDAKIWRAAHIEGRPFMTVSGAAIPARQEKKV